MRTPMLGWILLLAGSVLGVPLHSQQPGDEPALDRAQLAARDQRLTTTAVQGLNAIADALAEQKQFARALQLRREVWMDYDERDPHARETTGFVRVGELWRLDADKIVLDKDLKGDKAKLRKIDRDWDKLQKSLLAEHRALALALREAGDRDRARYHWQRVLRFAPDDEQANAAMAMSEFEGFKGTEHDLGLLRRGRAIRTAVDWLNRTAFPTRELTEPCPLLTAAGLTHSGVESEFFRIYGTLTPAELAIIAQDCERCLLLSHTLFGVSTGEAFQPVKRRVYVYTSTKEQYAAALTVCRSQFDEARFTFMRDEVDQCFVEHGGVSIRLQNAKLGMDIARDQAVRGVMQDATGVKSDGLWEGLGHMACGFLFGRTLVFLEEQQTAHTVASWTERMLAPDLDVWMKIAEESAWSKSDTRTGQLVLISAARFTGEQRVKAWAICQYLMHWHPEYVLELDRSRSDTIRTAPDVEVEFLRRTGYELPRIDDEWRDFWGRGAELRAAMVRDPLASLQKKDKAGAERSRGLLDAINAARAAARVGPAGWHMTMSLDLIEVRRYERELAKAQVEQDRRAKLAKRGQKVEPVEMPAPPPAIGRSVLWSNAAEPSEAVRQWLCRPAVRDRLLHPGRCLFGVPTDGGAFAVELLPPAEPSRRGPPRAWPRNEQRDVPSGCTVAELGPECAAALVAAGKAPADAVGTPLTLHWSRPIERADLDAVGCDVFAGNLRAHGVLLVPTPGAVDGEPPADGMVVFVPLEPLPPAAQIEVRWNLPATMLAKDERYGMVTFSTAP